MQAFGTSRFTVTSGILSITALRVIIIVMMLQFILVRMLSFTIFSNLKLSHVNVFYIIKYFSKSHNLDKFSCKFFMCNNFNPSKINKVFKDISFHFINFPSIFSILSLILLTLCRHNSNKNHGRRRKFWFNYWIKYWFN